MSEPSVWVIEVLENGKWRPLFATPGYTEVRMAEAHAKCNNERERAEVYRAAEYVRRSNEP